MSAQLVASVPQESKLATPSPNCETTAMWKTLGTSCLLGLAAATVLQAQTGTLVVLNKGANTVDIIDVASGQTLQTLPTGQVPHEAAISSDGRVVVTTDYGARARGTTLTIIDVPGMRVERTAHLGDHIGPHGIAFLPGDSLVAVTTERIAYRPVRKAGRIAALITAVCVSLILQNLAIKAWSAAPRAYPDAKIAIIGSSTSPTLSPSPRDSASSLNSTALFSKFKTAPRCSCVSTRRSPGVWLSRRDAASIMLHRRPRLRGSTSNVSRESL